MKITALIPTVLFATAVSALSVQAQDNPAPAPAPAASPATVDRINGVVYVDKLPTPTQLMKDAEEEGLTIVRLEQTAARVLVVYQYTDGSKRTFAYLPLSAAGTVPVTTSPAITSMEVVENPPTTIVYTEPRTIYYRTRYGRSYDTAWDFWGPVTLGFGLGWISGGHGGYHGGYHGGHGGYHGGHGRR